ncbi:MAG: lipid-binding SYLF domain-containing protein [Massilia sp.]
MQLQKLVRRAATPALQVLALACAASAAAAQGTTPATTQEGRTGGPAAGNASRAQSAAIRHVTNSTDVVRRMVSETGMSRLLAQARGIFILPAYGRAALGLGASGGAGVLSVRRSDGTWSEPAFFNQGGLSIGAQAGAEGGPIALVLNNDKAVDRFRQKNSFSLNADAGLTVVNWARIAQGSAGAGDVTAWAGTKGLFGNVATVGLSDIRFNQRATQAYYGQPFTVQDILDGKASNPHSVPLRQALAAASGGGAAK